MCSRAQKRHRPANLLAGRFRDPPPEPPSYMFSNWL